MNSWRNLRFLGLITCYVMILAGCRSTEVSPVATIQPTAAQPDETAQTEPSFTPTPTTLPPTAIPPTPTVTPTALPSGVIAVYPDRELQTIREVGGGNFVHWPHNTAAFEPISEKNLEVLSPTIVRARMSLDLWEPVNDNSDPLLIEQTGFLDEGPNRYTFEMLKKFEEENKLIIVSAWDVPDWMVTLPETSDQRVIRAELINEVVENITAWLLHARDQYGVSVDFISFNEADGGYHVLLSSSQYAALIRASAPRFTAEGLEVKWLLADTAGMGRVVSYARNISSEEDIRPYLGPLSFHSWDANSKDAVLQGIGEYAQNEGLEVWCTEAGYAPFLWQRPEEFPTWENAINIAAIYLRMLKMTRVTTLLYWEMMAQDYPLNDGTNVYPSLEFIKLMQEHFPAGAVVMDTSADPGDIKFSAARLPDGRISAVILNRGDEPVPLFLIGLPDGDYTLRVLGQAGLAARAEPLVSNKGIPVNINGASVYFIQSVVPQ
jgi:hypothetical protein